MKEVKKVLKEVRSLLANLDYHISKLEKDKGQLARSVKSLNKEILGYASEEKKQEKKAFKYAEFLANKTEIRTKKETVKQIIERIEKLEKEKGKSWKKMALENVDATDQQLDFYIDGWREGLQKLKKQLQEGAKHND